MAVSIPYVDFDGGSPAGPGIFDYLGRGKVQIVAVPHSEATVSYTGATDGGTLADALDGDSTTALLTNNTETNNIVWDFGAGVTKRIVHWAGWATAGYSDTPHLDYSDDGSSWTEVAAENVVNDWTEYSLDVKTTDPGFHRYWRIHDQGAGGRFHLVRMALYEFAGDWADYSEWTNPHSGSGLVVASQSSNLGATTHAEKAFDIRVGNDYRSHTNSDNPSWWKVDFGDGATVTPTTFAYRHPASRLFPSTYQIQGSNNDSDWTTLASDTGNALGYFNGAASVWTPGVPIVGSDPYRYIRINVVAASSLTYMTSGQIELFGSYSDGTGGGGAGGGGGIGGPIANDGVILQT